MNAGKTASLIQNNYNYKEKGMKTLCFKPKIDTRSKGLVSRTGLKLNVISIEKDFDFLEYIKKQKFKYDCIMVDEAQFLTKAQVNQLSRIVDELNIPVLTYGLRTDFQGNLFQGSQRLLAISDKLYRDEGHLLLWEKIYYEHQN